jgi:branched-chain amino acid aminotransferase
VDIYYVDGSFVPADRAVIPVNDLAVIRGYGVFDLLRTYQGSPFFLDAHVERLLHSAHRINLKVPWDKAQLIDIVLQTLDRNEHSESNVRIIITGGSSPDFMTPQGNPRLLVLVTPVPPIPEKWYAEGVKVVTMVTQRNMPDAKSIDYIPATMALQKARQQGAVEAIYIDRNGHVKEGTTSNLFAFFGKKLVTPGEGILQGVTRKVVLELAASEFDVEIQEIHRQTLMQADEVFITGTNKGLVPVVKIDTRVIGSGTPGMHTRRLMELLEQRVRAHKTKSDQ